MKLFLEPQDHQLLEQYAQDQSGPYWRAAQILLLTEQGYTIRQIAEKLGIARGSVFYWIRRYRNQKTAIFHQSIQPQSKRESNPPKPGESASPKKTSPQSKPNRKQDLRLKREKETQEETQGLPPQVFIATDPPEKPGIKPEESIAEAGRKTLYFHLLQMLHNEAGTIAGENIEALHDMRVAIRRMRAAFDVFGFAFKKRAIRNYLKGLRKTGRALGSVRDLDVLIENATQYLAKKGENGNDHLHPLLRIWQEQRQTERAKLLAHLESPAYLEFKQQFGQFLQSSDLESRHVAFQLDNQRQEAPGIVRHVVPLLIYQRLAIVSGFQTVIPHATVDQLHALRIECKRLRYTLEFFSEVLGPEAKLAIQQLKQIQDYLGELHDAHVAAALVAEILNSWEDRHCQFPLEARPDPLPVIDYLAYRIQERHRLIRNFPKIWGEFTRSEFRQNLALAVSSL